MPRALALAALLAVAGCASAARPAVALDHVALHVEDLGASVAFYERLFGVEEIPAPGDPAVIRWLALGDADVDAVAARAAALGVAYSDWPGTPSAVSVRPDGVRQIYVQDPDGHWIEVNDARR